MSALQQLNGRRAAHAQAGCSARAVPCPRQAQAVLTARRRARTPRSMSISRSLSRTLKYGVHIAKNDSPSEKAKSAALMWFEDVWNAENVEALADIASPDLVMVDPCCWREPYHGRTRVGKVIEEYLGAFKGFQHEVQEIMPAKDGSVVMVRWEATAMHLGTFMGAPASGKVERISGMSTFRFVGGRIARIEVFRESLSQERRGLGVADYGM